MRHQEELRGSQRIYVERNKLEKQSTTVRRNEVMTSRVEIKDKRDDEIEDTAIAEATVVDPSEVETIALIKRIQSGETHEFGALMKKYKNQVAGIAFRMVNDYDEAKDISQIVFVKTSRNLHRFDTTKRFSTWMYRIVVNATIDYMRKQKKHRHEMLDTYSDSIETPADTPDISLYRKNIKECILQAADALNDKQKAAFLLRDIDGHDIGEVSEILKMPEATVRWYLHRARLRLKKELLRKDPAFLENVSLFY
jgi:RNA polymerase sigma-70 factor, ECF subfamily